MNTTHTTLFLGLSMAFTLIAAPAFSQAQSSQAATTPPPAASQIPVYQPPLRGAPATRTGGSSRGKQDSGLILKVLAPESTGLTSRAQPRLYRYSSHGLKRR